MSPIDLINLMRLCTLAIVREELEALKKQNTVASTAEYETILKFYLKVDKRRRQ